MSGTVNISRDLWEDPAFPAESFSRREAWVWMIAEASWKDRQRNVGGKVVETKRGQLAASSRFLAKAWDWSEPKVRRFLDMLENRRMITRVTDAGITVITLCNYERYQNGGSVGDAPKTPDPTRDRRTSDANEKKGEIREEKKEEEGDARATEPRSEVVPLRVVASRSEPEPDDHELLRMVMVAADVPEFPIPHRWMPTTAATHVGNWRRGLGLTAAQIVEAIRLNRKARPDLGPARSPNAFDRMLAEYAAARLAPLPSPPVAATTPPSSRRSKPDERLAAWLDAARNPREPGVAGGSDRDPPQALLRD